jgi:Transport and Golgi organisation 2
MCTVTVLPEAVLSASRTAHEGRVRLRVSCNRDELIARAPALPPTMRHVGDRLAIMPVDPDSGGTWIGANDAGIICVLLNVYAGSRTIDGLRSRGTVIPPLLGCDRVDAVLERVLQLVPGDYSPFRLLVLDRGTLVECWNRERSIRYRRESLRTPVMRTSSGLGDDLVTGPRTVLFEQLLSTASDPIAADDLFHLHQWRGREELSVRMRRGDARTVSYTVVEIREGVIRLVYRPADAPDAVSVSLVA